MIIVSILEHALFVIFTILIALSTTLDHLAGLVDTSHLVTMAVEMHWSAYAADSLPMQPLPVLPTHATCSDCWYTHA